jgi:hypothetical protein
MSLSVTRKLRHSVQQEKRIARTTAATRTAGSGNQPAVGQKGDVKQERWLIEAKRTDNSRLSYSLKLSDWRKIECAAMRAAKEAAMVIEIGGRSLVVIDYQAFLTLCVANQY